MKQFLKVSLLFISICLPVMAYAAANYLFVNGQRLTINGGTISVTPSATGSAPQVLFTNVASGPNSGGENNKGIYLSVFGKYFGTTGMGTTVKLYINNVEVDNYRFLGTSRARPDIQEITAQIGAIGSPTPGVALPIKVTVNGVASNTDVTFIVQPGNFYFANNVTGNDATGAVNDITHPYRHVQTPTLSQAVWGQVQPGDVIVMRGTGTPWTDLSFEGYFLRYRDKSGNAPTGVVGHGPITVIGYPTEDVYIYTTKAAGFSGAISGINGSTFTGLGQWGAVSNLRVEGGGDDGCIDIEILGDGWRIVDNELTTITGQDTGRAGGVTGNGSNVFIYGNYIHDIDNPDPGLENHGIYIDNDGSYDIGYNYLKDINDGNGLQLYTYGYTSGTQYTQNVVFHHNWINNSMKHGLNIGDGTKSGIVIYDNVVINSHDAGIRFNTNTLDHAKIYNNTFYVSNIYGNSAYGMIMNDWNLPAGAALDMENNIFIPTAIGTTPGANSAYNLVSISGGGTFNNNLWYNGTGSVTDDTHPISGNPLFITNGSDFHIQNGSPAIGAGATGTYSVVTTDYDAKARSPITMDVGAYKH